MCAPPSTNNILGDLAAAFAGREISDVQVRTGGLMYLHTNRGLEIAESFGIMDSEAVGRLAEALFMRQSVEIWTEADAIGNAERMWEMVRSRRVIDFSCEEGALGSPVRMRVQVHLSEHGLGVTCRWLRALRKSRTV
ncbi:MAG TPA: hypothetical protein PLB55_12105 [Prosthecobacter sp.]|nr:hypothetical protein [Prosthecobacter sp.]